MMRSVHFACISGCAASLLDPVIDPKLVARVNANPGATWQAGYGKGRFANVTSSDAFGLLGAVKKQYRGSAEPSLGITTPDSFDMRDQYGHCKSVKQVYDQGSCGGCWAFAVSGSLGDRFCMLGHDVALSPQDLMDCDKEGHCSGCNGGLCEDAFDYINDEGIVSAECVPFTGGDSTCASGSCTGSGSDNTRYYSSWAKYVSSHEAEIKEEIFLHGSVTSSFEVFHDFFTYESGVYAHLEGDYAGLHAVNLMGWGTENGVDYWLVKNSWGPDFGEDGFFRIKRGMEHNGCNFEGGLTSATPSVSRSVAV